MELKDLKKFAKYPQNYLNSKLVKGQISDKAATVLQAEKNILRKKNAPESQSVSVSTFLTDAGFSAERASEISCFFNDFPDFLGANDNDFLRIRGVTLKEQRKMNRAIHKFRLGVLTRAVVLPPPESRPWNLSEDNALLEACSKYDVTFGDAWIYVAQDIGRDPESARKRFMEISLVPDRRKASCDIIVTASAEPLLFNRDFKLLPPLVVIVPSEENFHLHGTSQIPRMFMHYLDESVF